MRPIIGITVPYDEEAQQMSLRDYYTDSISRAGGIPILLAPTRDMEEIKAYLELCHGCLLSGGGDMDPYYWGEEARPELGSISPVRDYFEYVLTTFILEQGLPLLGICRGCQVMNVVCGGTLIQDLKTELNHQQKAPRYYASHQIRIENSSLLRCIMKREHIRVNSFHHQAVELPGKGLLVSARSSDGTVEAIESMQAGVFCLGVQWHPECMHDETARNLFKYFIDSCYRK